MIKPEATSRFVDKVKGIPTTISSRFHREKKSTILINGDTTYSSGNFESNGNSNIDTSIDTSTSVNSNGTKKGISKSDLLWLEEFNKEINSILESGNNKEGIIGNSDGNNEVETIVVEPEPDIVVEPEPDIIIIEKEQNISENKESSSNLSEIIGNVLNDGDNNQQGNSSNQSNNSQTTTQVNTSTILTEQQWGDCAEAGLTVQDCEDLVRDFWNYN